MVSRAARKPSEKIQDGEEQARTHFFILIFQRSTGFFFSAPGFFSLKVTNQKWNIVASRNRDGSPCAKRTKYRSRWLIWISSSEEGKNAMRSLQWQSYSMTPHKNTTTNTRAARRTHEARHLSCFYTQNPIFCRIADFIPLSLSHFFPLKNSTFYETFMLLNLIHQVSFNPIGISR